MTSRTQTPYDDVTFDLDPIWYPREGDAIVFKVVADTEVTWELKKAGKRTGQYITHPALVGEVLADTEDDTGAISVGERRVIVAKHTVQKSQFGRLAPIRSGDEIAHKYLGLADGKDYHNYATRRLSDTTNVNWGQYANQQADERRIPDIPHEDVEPEFADAARTGTPDEDISF